MVEDYYEEWGWDGRSGVPTARRLEELGLTEAGSPPGAR
jgi:aldehyde:ferredoxin oxidoreductase